MQMQPKTFHTSVGTFVLTYEHSAGGTLAARIEETVNSRPVGEPIRREIREITDLAVLLRDAEFPVEEAMRIAKVEWTWLKQTGVV